jgi:hypothetical protein
MPARRTKKKGPASDASMVSTSRGNTLRLEINTTTYDKGDDEDCYARKGHRTDLAQLTTSINSNEKRHLQMLLRCNLSDISMNCKAKT